MRFRLVPAVACLGLWAAPAAAQVQQTNPNAANESFGIQSQFRSLNQQRISDFNTLNMQAQRNAHFNAAPTPGPYGPIFRPGRGAVRAIRSPGLNTSICTGC